MRWEPFTWLGIRNSNATRPSSYRSSTATKIHSCFWTASAAKRDQLQRLTHPGICPIFEFGEIRGQFFLSMAYIEGRALEEYMARPDPIVPKQAATLIRRVAQAIAAAHDSGVIHRDLKPGNIMVNREARPVVMDFGLARQGHDTRLTQTGAFLGTPAYASPEQIKNADNDVDHRSDIYSLGVILYEMLAKRLPFVSGSVMGMVGEILTADPDSPTVHRPGSLSTTRAYRSQGHAPGSHESLPDHARVR